MKRRRLLDLYCCAGGAAKGYHDAGFEVVGVDIEDQPNFPYEFVQGSAFAALCKPSFWMQFDVIHASPPCQGYSTVTPKGSRSAYAKVIGPLREVLVATGKLYVIENVIAARPEMREPIMLCGSSFLLDVRRHRLFESNVPLTAPPCDHSWQTPRFQSLDGRMKRAGRLASVVGVHGHCNYAGEKEIRERAMGNVHWMTSDELAESVPPAYTEWLGTQLLDHLQVAAA